MPVTVADLRARLSLDTARFTAMAREAGGETKKLGEALQGTQTGAGRVSAALASTVVQIGAVAASVTAAALVVRRLTDQFVRQGLELRAIQAVSGLSAEAADNLSDTFQLLGFDSSALTTAMFRLGQQIDEGGEAIHKLGLGLRDSTGALKAEGELFLELRDRIASMGTASERSAALVELFGRAGRELAPAFALTRREFAAYAEQAASLSPMTEEIAAKQRELGIATNALTLAWAGFKLEIAALLAGPAAGLLSFLSEAIRLRHEAMPGLGLGEFGGGFGGFDVPPGRPPIAERLREPGGGAPFRPPFLGRPSFNPEQLRGEVSRFTEAMAELELATIESKREARIRSLTEAYDELAEVTARVERVNEDLEESLMSKGLASLELEAEATQKAWEGAVVDTAEALRRQQQHTRELVEDVVGSVRHAISEMVSGVLRGTQTMEEAFRRMGQNIALSLVETIVNRALRQIQEAIIDTIILSQSASGGGGLIGTILGAIGGLFGGGTVRGETGGVSLGDVVRSGQEGGMVTGTDPVLAVLHPPEMVLPLDRLPDLGGGRPSVQQVFNVAALTPEGIRREIWAMMPEFERRAVDAVLEASGRGGPMARAMGRRGR